MHGNDRDAGMVRADAGGERSAAGAGRSRGRRGKRTGIGLITPSANVVVEEVAIALAGSFPEVSVHFSRIAVAGSVDPNPDGYDLDAMLAAASLLADARPAAIVWAGSKGASVGLDRDRELCARIEQRCSIPATTPTLALAALVAATGRRRIGLVSPYTASYQDRLVAGLSRMGLTCTAERHSGLADNLSYADVGAADIRAMARAVAASGPEMVLAWCTNLAAATLAKEIEDELGLPFVDATALGLFEALRLAGVDTAPAAADWGGPFALAAGMEP